VLPGEVSGRLGEPSLTTNMMFGTPARSLAVLVIPVLMPSCVGVPLLPADGRLPTAVLKLVADTYPDVRVVALPGSPWNVVRLYRPSPPRPWYVLTKLWRPLFRAACSVLSIEPDWSTTKLKSNWPQLPLTLGFVVPALMAW